MRTPLERRRRLAARLALYGSLAALLAALALGFAFLRRLATFDEDLSWVGVDFAAIPAVSLLQRYLQVDTSQPDADELAGARFLASVLAEAGIPSTIETLGGRHANLFAVLEGRDPRAVVLHSHIDTDPVPAPETWRHPPFAGQIEGPHIYGRGAFDMKSIAVAQLAAFLDLEASGAPLERSVVLLATGSEEVGSDLGVKWILSHRPDWARRFALFLTEGGTVEATTDRDVKYWGVEYLQKRNVEVTLCGPSEEHLRAIREEVVEQAKSDFAPRLAPEVEPFLRRYAPTRQRADFRRALGEPGRLLRDAPGFLALPPYLRSFLADEVIALPVEADPGGGFRLRLRFHLLPGSDFASTRERFLPAWRTEGVAEAVYDEGGAPGGSPLDHQAYRAMEEALAEARPEAVVGPLFLVWSATDARFARAAGIPAYGFSPFVVYATETYKVGQPDERFSLPGFIEGVEVYRRLVAQLAGARPAQGG